MDLKGEPWPSVSKYQQTLSTRCAAGCELDAEAKEALLVSLYRQRRLSHLALSNALRLASIASRPKTCSESTTSPRTSAPLRTISPTPPLSPNSEPTPPDAGHRRRIPTRRPREDRARRCPVCAIRRSRRCGQKSPLQCSTVTQAGLRMWSDCSSCEYWKRSMNVWSACDPA